MRILIRWLRGELRNINRKLDQILALRDEIEAVSRQTRRLRRATDDLYSAVNKQKP